jgi:hypothetical protein
MSENSQVANNSAGGAAAQERREHPRYPFSASAEAVHLQADTRLNGRVSDVGRGGCYIDTINPFPVGADVRLRVMKGDTSFVAQGRVLYAAPGMGMGLAFTKIEPARIHVLEQWLKELRESSPGATALEEEDNIGQLQPHSENESKYVLNELIVAVVRKRVLTESEGHALLKKLVQ